MSQIDFILRKKRQLRRIASGQAMIQLEVQKG